ncbi:hypothetical protein L2449_09400 [Mesorhizobium muleiense]|uniref:hypothetical protein n=1 Tax=Mesorhizobium muleiense TaxID=1004279 RepID=UPI001F2B4BB8|nr:hypothetical protein [Mesorhizobium muleiense]MCF6117128.1 hypothetical protein [Mesorhizobium muleiense]
MLKVADVDSERMLLRIERGKGGRYRTPCCPKTAYSSAAMVAALRSTHFFEVKRNTNWGTDGTINVLIFSASTA